MFKDDEGNVRNADVAVCIKCNEHEQTILARTATK